MKIRGIAFLAGFALIGCGSAGGGNDDLAGNWIVYQGTCARGYNFTGLGGFNISSVCPLADGTIGLQEQNGSYRVAGAQIQFTNQTSTCPANQTMGGGASLPWGVTYSVSSSQLVLTFTNGIVSLQRNTASGGSAQATFGCFDASGNFTASTLAPI